MLKALSLPTAFPTCVRLLPPTTMFKKNNEALETVEKKMAILQRQKSYLLV